VAELKGGQQRTDRALQALKKLVATQQFKEKLLKCSWRSGSKRYADGFIF
jgi:hypothetical protein